MINSLSGVSLNSEFYHTKNKHSSNLPTPFSILGNDV